MKVDQELTTQYIIDIFLIAKRLYDAKNFSDALTLYKHCVTLFTQYFNTSGDQRPELIESALGKTYADKHIASCYWAIGNCYHQLRQNKQALQYLSLCLDIANKTPINIKKAKIKDRILMVESNLLQAPRSISDEPELIIFDIPNEMLYNIALYLTPKELLTFLAVCKTFREIADDQRLWIKHIEREGLQVPEQCKDYKKYYFEQQSTPMSFFERAQSAAEANNVNDTMQNAMQGLTRGMQQMFGGISDGATQNNPPVDPEEVMRGFEGQNQQGGDPFRMMGQMIGGAMGPALEQAMNQQRQNQNQDEPQGGEAPVDCKMQ